MNVRRIVGTHTHNALIYVHPSPTCLFLICQQTRASFFNSCIRIDSYTCLLRITRLEELNGTHRMAKPMDVLHNNLVVGQPLLHQGNVLRRWSVMTTRPRYSKEFSITHNDVPSCPCWPTGEKTRMVQPSRNLLGYVQSKVHREYKNPNPSPKIHPRLPRPNTPPT